MRTLAYQTILDAAVSAGLPADAVMHAPGKETIDLPSRRIEISYLPEQYKRTGGCVGKHGAVGQEKTHRTVRRRVYVVRLSVRVRICTDDEVWLRTFSRACINAIPKRIADEFGNAVSVKVEKSEYGGFVRHMVEVFKKRSQTLVVSFSGMTTRDETVPLMRDIQINQTYREKGNGKK